MLYEPLFDFLVLLPALFFLARRNRERFHIILATAFCVAICNLSASFSLRGLLGLSVLLLLLLIDALIIRWILISDFWRSLGAATILAVAKFAFKIALIASANP